MGIVPSASIARACMTVDWTEANSNISSASSAAVVEVLAGGPNVIVTTLPEPERPSNVCRALRSPEADFVLSPALPVGSGQSWPGESRSAPEIQTRP